MDEKILKWKLSEKPTADNILQLVNGGIITKEEAKKIILDEGQVSQSDIEELKGEVTLLRKMVLGLSEKVGKEKEIIRIIEREIPVYKYYYQNPFWRDNIIWANNYLTTSGSFTTTTGALNNLTADASGSLTLQAMNMNTAKAVQDFPNIINAVSKLNIK